MPAACSSAATPTEFVPEAESHPHRCGVVRRKHSQPGGLEPEAFLKGPVSAEPVRLGAERLRPELSMIALPRASVKNDRVLCFVRRPGPSLPAHERSLRPRGRAGADGRAWRLGRGRGRLFHPRRDRPVRRPGGDRRRRRRHRLGQHACSRWDWCSSSSSASASSSCASGTASIPRSTLLSRDCKESRRNHAFISRRILRWRR